MAIRLRLSVAQKHPSSYKNVILRTMKAKQITPILNVSDMEASFAWFAKWGWRKCVKKLETRN